MGFISSLYGTFGSYLSTFGTKSYIYHVRLISSTTTENLTLPVAGITNQGKKQKRHEVYHGMFTYITVGLQFSCLSGGGGDILKAEYDANGIRGQCSVIIYRKNNATGDFDEYFTGNADFNEDSYKYIVDENGAEIVSIDVLESGLVNRLLSRDQLELNLARNTSVGGSTITDVSTVEVTLSPINIYLDAVGDEGTINRSISYSSTQTDYAYFTIGNEIDNRIGDSFNFDPTSGGLIYENNRGYTIYIRAIINAGYSINTVCGTGSIITVTYQLRVYDESSVLMHTENLASETNNAGGDITQTGTIDVDIDYASLAVPDGGSLRFVAQIDVTKGTGLADIITMTFPVGGDYTFYEKSESIGSTTATMYQVYQAFLKLFRLCTDTNDCFQSDYLTDLSNLVSYDYISSGRNIRKFPNNWVVTSLRDLFEHVEKIWPIMMSYDGTRFYIEELDEAYQNTQIVDFGIVDQMEIVPDGYYNKLLTGYDNDGKLEELQGALMFNLRSEHNINFEINSSINIRGKYHMSGVEFELIRRQQYSSTGLTDNDQDKDIFYCAIDIYNAVLTCQNGSFQGWAGIEENYNPFYTPKQNLLKNKWLKGLFRYDTGEYIKFSSNQKNVEYSYLISAVRVNETDDIPQADLATPLYYPERQTFLAPYSPAIRAAIDANPHGYYKATDKAGNVWYGFFTDMEVKDFERTIKVIGKTKV
jgi:hypothetical protein